MIEKLVSEIIQEDFIEVKVLDKTYRVAQPTTATLIECSKYISQIPKIDIDENRNITLEALRVAKDCSFIGDVVAILILGKKGLKTTVTKSKYFGLKKYQVEKDNQKELSKILLEELTPKELNDLGNIILSKMDIGFFLGFTISLQEVNLTKPTKTTASGH